MAKNDIKAVEGLVQLPGAPTTLNDSVPVGV